MTPPLRLPGLLARLVAPLLAAAFSLTACSAADDATPDYRYRLTVEVDTPKGLRTGSSVIEVRQSMGRTAMSGFGKAINRRAYGEAVAVDLPDGRVLFALLRSENNVDWASSIMQQMAPKTSAAWEDSFDDVLLIRGEKELPRRFLPPNPAWEPRDGYPMLVTFGDLDDPTSVERVDPDDLATSFGEGTELADYVS